MKAVVLAGGGGKRLWPLSTPEKPKQFQKLISEKTMLEETLDRLDFLKPGDIYLAINEKHLQLTQELCPQIPAANLLVEPALCDTAACIGLAAAILEKRHPGEVMAVIYADHLIKNKKEFQRALKLAEKIAIEKNTLNIVEVEAHEPNINYGYVKLGREISPSVYTLDSFKEKPDLETARKFVASGRYLWNTGIYVWKTGTLLEQYQKLQPKTHASIIKMAENGDTSGYPKLEKISLDYAIMEKINPSLVRIIKADLGWSDIGNWEAIWRQLAKNPTENITRGPVELKNCRGCLVYADHGKKISLENQTDMIIVDTENGHMEIHKKDSAKVKELAPRHGS